MNELTDKMKGCALVSSSSCLERNCLEWIEMLAEEWNACREENADSEEKYLWIRKCFQRGDMFVDKKKNNNVEKNSNKCLQWREVLVEKKALAE